MKTFELCGWIGAVLVLIAYYMVSTSKVKADSRPFQAINVFGAILLVIYTYNCQAYASMIVNVIWIGIGLSSFAKFMDFSKVNLQKKFIFKRSKLYGFVLGLIFLPSTQPVYSQKIPIQKEFIKEDTNSFRKNV